jgi:inner membrane protein
MDNLTHTAVGLFLSRLGLNRWTPAATPILLLAANAPDIDIVTLAGGPVSYLHYHRHLTHSLAAMPVLALAAVALVRFAGRRPVRWAGAFAAALIGVASHLLLDLTNVYGVRLLLPFSGEWQRLDTTSIVDLCIWAILLMGVAAPFLGRLVGGEITSGKAKFRHYGRGGAIFALTLVLLYDCARGVFHQRAVAVLQARLYQGAEPARVAAMPNPANPLLWRGLVETDDFYAVEDVNLTTDFDPMRAAIFHKAEPDPAIGAARDTAAFRVFLSFSQFPLWRVLPIPDPENGKAVSVLDMRFGSPVSPGFAATAIVDARNRVLRTSVRWGSSQPR